MTFHKEACLIFPNFMSEHSMGALQWVCVSVCVSVNVYVQVRACASVQALSVYECASVTVHSLISQPKNRTWLIRERRELQREIRNPIQWRALVHCNCGRGHSQFQKEQVLYIRVWRDGRPSCSLS